MRNAGMVADRWLGIMGMENLKPELTMIQLALA